MPLSKLWLLLVATVAGVALALVGLTPKLAAGDLDREVGAKLSRGHQAIAQVLKVNARQWIDSVTHISGDAVLLESLDQASRTPADLTLIHRTVQERLKTFNDSMKAGLLWAIDSHGRVIARIGTDEDVFKDSVEGLPLVADALRGLRSDDTWSLDGKLYRVAASPLVTRERYVGALVIGQEMSSELAQSMKQKLDLDVVFLLDGKVIASSSTLPILQQLPKVADAHLPSSPDEATAPIRIEENGQTYFAVLGPFAGEAAGQHAAFVVVAPRPPMLSLASLMGRIQREEQLGHLLAPFGAGILFAFLVGWVLHSLEHDRAAQRLLRDARALERGELPRLNASRLNGSLGQSARAINAVLDRILSPSQGLRSPFARSINEEITRPPAKAEKAAKADKPPKAEKRDRTPQPPERAADAEPEPMSAEQSRSRTTSPERAIRDEAAEPENTAPSVGLELSAADEPSPPILPPMEAEALHASARAPFAAEPESIGLPDGFGATSLLSPAGGFGIDDGSTTVMPSADLSGVGLFGRTSQNPVAPAETFDPIDAELRHVYNEFIETKQRCGESIEGLNFEKFGEKLRNNRDQLMSRNPGKTVRFAVYVKDGKAALKASVN